MNREFMWALGLAITSRLVQTLPKGHRYRWAAAVGRGVSHLFPAKRQAVKNNLEFINRQCGTRFSVDRVFENFGMTLADFLSGRPMDLRVEGRDRAEAAQARGRGTMFLTTHLGNWELGGRIFADWGWPVTAVFQPYRSRAMQRFIQTRRAPALTYLAVGRGAARGVARALHRRESVAMLADRPFGEDGVPVALLGGTARLPRGPFLFACRGGTPVLPGFVIMEHPGHYRVMIEEALWPEGRDGVQNLMDKMAQVLGKYLTRHAEQWFCFESVWESSEGHL